MPDCQKEKEQKVSTNPFSTKSATSRLQGISWTLLSQQDVFSVSWKTRQSRSHEKVLREKSREFCESKTRRHYASYISYIYEMSWRIQNI